MLFSTSIAWNGIALMLQREQSYHQRSEQTWTNIQARNYQNQATRNIELIPGHEILPGAFSVSPNFAPEIDIGLVVQKLAANFHLVPRLKGKVMNADTQQAFLRYKETCLVSLRLDLNNKMMDFLGASEWIIDSTTHESSALLDEERRMKIIKPRLIKTLVEIGKDERTSFPRLQYNITGDRAIGDWIEGTVPSFRDGK
jgi:hypothetical protein